MSLDARVCEKRKNLTTDESQEYQDLEYQDLEYQDLEYLTTEGTEGTEDIAKIISFFSVPSVVSHVFVFRSPASLLSAMIS